MALGAVNLANPFKNSQPLEAFPLPSTLRDELGDLQIRGLNDGKLVIPTPGDPLCQPHDPL